MSWVGDCSSSSQTRFYFIYTETGRRQMTSETRSMAADIARAKKKPAMNVCPGVCVSITTTFNCGRAICTLRGWAPVAPKRPGLSLLHRSGTRRCSSLEPDLTHPREATGKRSYSVPQHFLGLGEPATVTAVCAFEKTGRMPMKTLQRAARFRDLAAECSSLATATPMPQMRDQYSAMARHYLILAETHGRKARPDLQRERLKGRKFKFGKKPSIAA
jgi:hypothetical protein